MDWFKGVDFNQDACWIDNEVVFDYNIWKDHRKVVDHMAKEYVDKASGERAGLIGSVERAGKALDALKDLIEDESIYLFNQEQVDKEFATAGNAWDEGCKIWFNNGGLVSWVEEDDNGEEVEMEQIVMFGPWCIWSKKEWLDLFKIYPLED